MKVANDTFHAMQESREVLLTNLANICVIPSRVLLTLPWRVRNPVVARNI